MGVVYVTLLSLDALVESGAEVVEMRSQDDAGGGRDWHKNMDGWIDGWMKGRRDRKIRSYENRQLQRWLKSPPRQCPHVDPQPGFFSCPDLW